MQHQEGYSAYPTNLTESQQGDWEYHRMFDSKNYNIIYHIIAQAKEVWEYACQHENSYRVNNDFFIKKRCVLKISNLLTPGDLNIDTTLTLS